MENFWDGFEKEARLQTTLRKYLPGYGKASTEQTLRKAYRRRETKLLSTEFGHPKKGLYRAQRASIHRKMMAPSATQKTITNRLKDLTEKFKMKRPAMAS